MGKKLYVGNLSFSADDNTLAEIFSEVGQVDSARVIIDRETGRSKGFGFVEMSTEDAAQAAISRFNGAVFNGRPLTVNEARPQEPRNGGGGGRGGYGGRGGDRGRY